MTYAPGKPTPSGATREAAPVYWVCPEHGCHHHDVSIACPDCGQAMQVLDEAHVGAGRGRALWGIGVALRCDHGYWNWLQGQTYIVKADGPDRGRLADASAPREKSSGAPRTDRD